jgi:tetratricopeptide (TPR) repeat protein
VFSSRLFTCNLDSLWRKITFLAAIDLSGILLIAQIGRIAIAEHLGASSRLQDVSRAGKLDPVNAEYRYRLGLFYEYDLQNMDVSRATRYFKEATSLQPNRADYFSSLGHACFTAGDDVCADQAYENSVRLAPALPRYQWDIANYYLLTGRQKLSLSHFRRCLELSPDDATPTFRVCLRALSDPELIWRTLLEGIGDSNIKLAYVNFLNGSGYSEAAWQFWNRIAASGSKVSFSAAQPYIDRLIATNHVDQASKVWQDLERIGVIRRPEIGDPGNLIVNGGFEHEPLNSGFDWHNQRQEYLNLDFANRDGYDGRRCLRVDFTVPNNAEYEPVYQIVPVQPTQQYLLTAYAHSVDISSDAGPRLRVVDLECPVCLSGESQAVVGTTPWHEISLSFYTGRKTTAVRVSLWRPRSRSFPMEIQGHFWLTAVSLKAIQGNEAARDRQLR